MKTSMMAVSLLALLGFAGHASAAVTLDFGTGDAGSAGTITVSGSNASGSGIAIDSLTVTADGAYDGVYDVIGTVNGSGEHGVGSLTFNTATNTITITGGITCAGLLTPTTACSAGDISSGKVLVAAGTTLLMGTGTISDLTITPFLTSVGVVFTDADTKNSTLLMALGLPGNTGFNLGSFTLGGQGSGGTYIASSTDILNTSVPEPTSILLLGTVLFGVTGLIRRRTRKA